ncbi:beta strand repeat-containing protein, partial [Coralloluteibacterium thermophilus]
GRIDGSLTATSNGGNVGQSGALSVGGTAGIDAGSGDIALADAGNAFGDVVTLTGGVAAIHDSGGLTLGTLDVAGLTASSGGALNLGQGRIGGDLVAASGGNAITQSGALTVDGTSALDAGRATIDLTHAGNDFGGAVSLTGGTVTIRDANALTLGTLDVTALDAASGATLDLGQGDIAGNLTANAGGAVSQTGALAVGGMTTIDANGHAIVLDDAGNDFAGVVNLAGGAAAIRDANALRLGMLDVAALDATAAAALDLGQGDIAGGLIANAGGAVSQSGALAVGGTTRIDANGHAIALADAGNDFAGVVNLAGGATAIRDANALTLGALDVAALDATAAGALDLGQGDIAGDLTANAGGAVSQAGALTVGGTTRIDANGHTIVLDDIDNDFGGTVSLAGGTVAIRDANALRFGTLDVAALDAVSGGALDLGQGAIAGDLAANAGGAVSQVGALTVGGTTRVDANGHAIALADAGNDFAGVVNLAGGATAIRGANALTLGTLDVTALDATAGGALNLGQGDIAGDLTANAGGAVTQSGALTVDGTTTVDANGHAIVLDDAGNDFAGTVNLAGGATAIRDANGLRLGALDVAALDVAAGGALDLGQGGIAGNLTVDASGAVSQRAALTVGGTTTIDANGHAIALADAGNDFRGVVSLIGGDTIIRDVNALALGTLDVGALNATSHGDLGLGRGSVLGDLVATTNGGAVTQSGALGVGGSVRIDSQAGGGSSRMAGTITLADGGNDFRGGVHLRGGDTTIRDANQLTLGTLDVGALTATSQGELDLGQGSIRGDLDARSNGGDIGQSGALRIGGETVLAAGNGDIVLDDIGNDFVGGVRAGGHGVRLADANDLHVLGLDSGGGDVSLHALGRLTVPALDVGGGALTLINGTGSLTTHGALRGAEISLSAQDDIVLAHDIAAGRLALEAGGDIAQQGGALAADALTGRAGGVVSLEGANAVAAVGGFTAGAFTLRTSGPLAVTGDLVADGPLSLHVGQGGLALAATAQGRDVRLEVDGDIEAGGAGRIGAGTLSGHAGGATRLGGADGFVDNRIGILGDFRSHGGFSLSNGQDLTLSSLNGSAHSVDAGEAAFHLSLQGSLRQAGTAPILNGTGSYAVTGGIGTMDSPIYVVGHQPQVVQALGIPPAYFYATHVDGTPLPIEGNAVNVPTSVFSSRAQASLNRTVAYVDLGADASNYRPYGVVQPGVRLPADQQPECDPDFPSPECVEAQAASEPVASAHPGAAAQQRMWLQ